MFRRKLKDHLESRIRDSERQFRFARDNRRNQDYWNGKIQAYKEIQAINNGELRLP